MMKAVILTAALVAITAVISGCGTTGLPVKVTDAYTVAPGESVGLTAMKTTDAFVAKVEVDLSQIEIPLPFKTNANSVPISGTGWLVFGAERQGPETNNVIFPNE